MNPVILVSLDWRRPQDGKTGLGIGSIAAALQANQVPCRIIDAQVNSPGFSLDHVLHELLQAIAEAGPGCLVGFGTYVWNDQEVQILIHQIKGTGARIVLGGPQISYMGKGHLESIYPEADYFVRGQGEMGMVAIAIGNCPKIVASMSLVPLIWAARQITICWPCLHRTCRGRSSHEPAFAGRPRGAVPSGVPSVSTASRAIGLSIRGSTHGVWNGSWQCLPLQG
ncbi:hypothetical protein Q427_11360 [Halomonas sp. BC04]|nr:hypothetical protein Q427_11360 [Halomonas sp. BC04]